MSEPYEPKHGWLRKFANAFRGVSIAPRRQSSFAVHAIVGILVVAGGAYFQVTATEWCLLVLCIASVLAAELFNTAIERLARAITQDHDPNIGDALDIASGAVLLAALGSATVGAIIFVPRLISILG